MKYPDKVSPHISFVEATRSRIAEQHNLKNMPDAKSLENMIALAQVVFEPMRQHFGKPIRVSSFYRSKQVNALLSGASASSQHCKGEAIDLDNNGHLPSNAEIFNFIKDHLVFDQLIWEGGTTQEPGWVHVSYKKNGNNRKQILFLNVAASTNGAV